MERKLKLYQQAGVREYWIVDPENNGLTVHCFQDGKILTNTYGKDGVVSVSVIPGLEIALEQVFA